MIRWPNASTAYALASSSLCGSSLSAGDVVPGAYHDHMTPRITWPVALVVAALIAAVTVAIALDKPVTELASLGNLILMALLYGEIQTVKTQTNGQTHRLMSTVDRVVQSVTDPSGQLNTHNGLSTQEPLTTQGVQPKE